MWNLTVHLIAIIALIVVTKWNQNVYLYFLGLLVLVELLLSQRGQIIEHLQVSGEAVQNVGSIYNSENLVVANIKATKSLTSSTGIIDLTDGWKIKSAPNQLKFTQQDKDKLTCLSDGSIDINNGWKITTLPNQLKVTKNDKEVLICDDNNNIKVTGNISVKDSEIRGNQTVLGGLTTHGDTWVKANLSAGRITGSDGSFNTASIRQGKIFMTMDSGYNFEINSKYDKIGIYSPSRTNPYIIAYK